MKQESSSFHSLMHCADLMDRRVSTLLTSAGIKPRQARVLNALSRMGEVSQKALIDSFDVTSGSMSTMIDRMEAAGLVERRRNPRDRRADLLKLTSRGATLVKDVRNIWQGMDDLIAIKLGSEKAAQLAELTRELKFALGGKVAASRESVELARRATEDEVRHRFADPDDA